MTAVPSYVIIGAMKAGTTTLHAWLSGHPDVRVPVEKELNHLSSRSLVARGPSAYFERFPEIEYRMITGEASPSYLLPANAPTVAGTVAEWLPSACLIVLLRDPIARLHSHYQHEVLRSRESRPLGEALADPASPYLAASEYHHCLQPYVDAGLSANLHVVLMEDLYRDGGETWQRLLQRLGLARVARPGSIHNQSAAKAKFTRPMLFLFERGLHRYFDRAPRVVRRLGRQLLLREVAPYDAAADLAPEHVLRLASDRRRLERDFGLNPPWPPLNGPG